MKYFKAEMWAGWNSNDDRRSDRAFRQWNRNLAAYKRSLPRLTKRLGRYGSFFLRHSMHDARVISFNIHDYPLRNLGPRPVGSHSWVTITLLTGDRAAVLYELIYDDLRSIEVQTKNDLFSLESSRFGDWGYDELLPHGKTAVRHNILFSAGTEISICFGKFRFRKMKSSNKSIERIVSPLCGLTSAHG